MSISVEVSKLTLISIQALSTFKCAKKVYDLIWLTRLEGRTGYYKLLDFHVLSSNSQLSTIDSVDSIIKKEKEKNFGLRRTDSINNT